MIIEVENIAAFKHKALHWAASFDVACYMDSNGFTSPYSKFDVLIAAGVKHQVTANKGGAFKALEDFKATHQEWMTGFLGYDLKNETEKLYSRNEDNLRFPDLYFFVPQHLIVIKDGKVEISSDDRNLEERILRHQPAPGNSHPNPHIKARFSKQAYIDTVNEIKGHISRGDIYVTNFCQEFFVEDAIIDPVETFNKLNEVSPNPFSCFFKYHHQYILCASPERFLAKRCKQLISQPIKGTGRRYRDPAVDEQIKHQLKSNAKERQENVMIVDLVRNDLTRSAVPGTVLVEELFGIYSFEQVHQMISTIVCELDVKVSTTEAVKNSFPMGSMTGAPKVSAMHLMELYERSKRGIYSGTVGYFSPDGDFDFNVVIRSILYNQTEKYLSFQAGSAITYHARAEDEYEECLLKIKAILEVLGQPGFYPQP